MSIRMPAKFGEFEEFEKSRGITLMKWQSVFAKEYLDYYNDGVPMRRWTVYPSVGKTFLIIELSKFVLGEKFGDMKEVDDPINFRERIEPLLYIREDSNSVLVAVVLDTRPSDLLKALLYTQERNMCNQASHCISRID